MLPHLSTAPIPALCCPRCGGRGVRGAGKDRNTNAHTHTHSESGSCISPPSALLSPIVQTRGRTPRGWLPPLPSPNTSLGGAPRGGKAWAKFDAILPLPQPPSLWVFPSSACDPCLVMGAKRELARNCPRESPSCHLPKLGRKSR